MRSHPEMGALRDRFREIDLRLLAGLLLVVFSAWTFLELADDVRERDTQGIDERIVTFFRKPGAPTELRGPPRLAEAVRDVTALGGTAVVALVVLAVAGFLLILGKHREWLLVLAATLGALLLSTLFKELFERTRPDLPPVAGQRLTSASFPSGHATLAAAVYLTLGSLLMSLVDRFALKLYLLTLTVLLAFLVGATRVVLGVHYPSDVLAGWMLGLGWSAVCWLASRYLRRRGAVERIG